MNVEQLSGYGWRTRARWLMEDWLFNPDTGYPAAEAAGYSYEGCLRSLPEPASAGFVFLAGGFSHPACGLHTTLIMFSTFISRRASDIQIEMATFII